jgi:hypothetical protein
VAYDVRSGQMTIVKQGQGYYNVFQERVLIPRLELFGYPWAHATYTTGELNNLLLINLRSLR